MAIITTDELNTYLNDYNDDYDIIALKQAIINAAQSVIENYLGYEIVTGEVDEETITFINKVEHCILLPKYANYISELKTNGSVITNIVRFGFFYYKDADNLYINYKNCEITAKGIFAFTTIPDVIKISCLKIASLMYMETNKRIGVSGVQLPDGLGHQYISYNNYDKHLFVLNSYRMPWRFANV